MMNLAIAVKLRGGDFDFNPKVYTERQASITHVIVDSYRSPVAAQVISWNNLFWNFTKNEEMGNWYRNPGKFFILEWLF